MNRMNNGPRKSLKVDRIMECNFAQREEDKSRTPSSSDGTKDTSLEVMRQRYQDSESREPRATSSCTLYKQGKLRNGEPRAIEPMHPSQITSSRSLISNRHDLRCNQMKKMKISPRRFLKMAETAAMQSKKECSKYTSGTDVGSGIGSNPKQVMDEPHHGAHLAECEKFK